MKLWNLVLVAVIIVEVAAQGNTCASPFAITSYPFSADGTTVGFLDNFSFPASECPGIPAATGAGFPDNIYSFTATTLTDFTITVHNPSFSAVVYLFANCSDVGGSCRGADNHATPQLIVTLQAGTYYIVVDGAPGQGTYTLTVETSTAYFTSATATDTSAATTSQPAKSTTGTFTPGENCAHPWVVDSVPFYSNGDTALFLNYYTIPAKACPYQQGERGAGSPDVSYNFTPNTSGIYTFTLYNTTFDSVLSVVQDCNNINSTCLEGRDLVGAGAVETFALSLKAQSTYYIIVDGYNNDPMVNVSGQYSFSVVAGGSLTVPTSAPVTSATTNIPTSQTRTTQTTNAGTSAQTSQGLTSNQQSSNSANATQTTADTSSTSVVSQTEKNNEANSGGMLKPIVACVLLIFFYLN